MPPIKTLDPGSGYPIVKHRLIGDVRIITRQNLVSLYHLGSYCFQDQYQFHSDKRLSDIIKKPCLVIIRYWIELNKPTSLIVTKPLNMSVNTTELTPITISFAAKLIAKGPLLRIGYLFQIFIYLRFIILPGQLNLHDLQRFRSDTNYKISGISYFPQIFSGILLEKNGKNHATAHASGGPDLSCYNRLNPCERQFE